MRKAIVFACLVLAACASGKPQPEQPPASPLPLSPADEAGARYPEYGDYGRVAVAILQISEQPVEEDAESRAKFLSYIDQPTSVRIVAGAFQMYFSEEEAARIADFLESPAGQAGMRTFSRWLLKGKFLKEPVPSELPSAWDAFRSTASGIKLFAKAFPVYKQIAVEAFKAGGALVSKAISTDIGKEAALSIFGALLKTGVSFL